MACFTIRVSFIHRETDVVVCELAITCHVEFPRARGTAGQSGTGGCEERVPAFGTEEVLLVVGSFPEGRIIQGDETFVNDGCFAMKAARCEGL